MYVSLYEEPHLYTKKRGLDVMQIKVTHYTGRVCMYVGMYEGLLDVA